MSSIPTLTAEAITARYGKVSTLGKGAFGKAYLIKDLGTNQLLVLKQIAAKKGGQGAEKEAALLSTLDHPNIVKFCDAFWTSGGRLCLVMTYCDGGDLHSLLKKQNNVLLSEKNVMTMFVQLCFAVQYIHNRRIIHRDLKSSNVFMMSDGRACVGDFGISRVLERTKELAKTLVGTPYYLSPEILHEQGYSFASDIWSLGVILYELATLKHPFDAGNLHSLALRIMKGDFQDPDETKFSFELRQLIRDMLRQEPDRRPNVNQILKSGFLQKPIKDVLAKFPIIKFEIPQEETILLSPINLTAISEAPTVKYDENEYEDDFEDYDDYFQQDDISEPTEIFNYIADQIGYEKAVKLFQMIQSRVDLEIDDATFRAHALHVLEDPQLVDRILPLAEAAVFLSFSTDENYPFSAFRLTMSSSLIPAVFGLSLPSFSPELQHVPLALHI